MAGPVVPLPGHSLRLLLFHAERIFFGRLFTSPGALLGFGVGYDRGSGVASVEAGAELDTAGGVQPLGD